MDRKLSFKRLFVKTKKLWDKIPVRHRGAIITAIPAACLFTTLGGWVWSRENTFRVYQQIDQTKTIILDSNQLLKLLLDAETGSRGYRLTRNLEFLQPYNTATKEIPSSLKSLQGKILDNSQLAKLQNIEALSQQRLKILEQKNTDVKQNLLAKPVAENESSLKEGKLIMDRIRAEINTFQQHEWRKLDIYRQYLNNIQDINSNILLASVSISIISYLGAIYLFSKLDWQIKGQELKLNQRNNLLQGIVENVVDGIITLNEQGKINSINPAASRMFGYILPEIVGQDLELLILDDKQQEKLLPWKFTNDKSCSPLSVLGHGKVGQPFPIEISISDLSPGNQKIVIIRDVTERLRAKEKLEANVKELSRISLVLADTNETLIERNQELDQFAYIVSHDLKAPLRAISNLSTWIEEDLKDKLPTESQYQMQLLRQRVARMEDLINGLLEYSRVGRVQTKSEFVNVGIMLAEIIDSLDPPPTFIIEIEAEMPTLTTKALLLRQVFTNLISNAIKHHNRPDGRVNISVKDLGEFYEFVVADDGVGIDPEFHDKIFTIFQTLKSRDSKENTGIGLAIVKKIIESEGCMIRLESQVSQGSTFRFTWRKII
ncbi:MAG: CHASE3 domain-containing protein [Scytonematopsis contorta HA4267-MV1]|jgi:PAS domain S-box-containing protein|nr:CHASE3 domain-containing protein [Scytonematopsis contorta HA4267-MV1]